MAEIRGGFFENTDYKAEDFALSHEAIITQGVVADVTEDTEDALLVLPGEDMNILVNPGYCWIKGGIGVFFGCASATVQLSVASADATYARIDRVIVRKDSNNKTFSIEILKGVASSAPEAPTLTRNGTVDEICLAEITIPAGAIEITQSMIVDKRHDTSVCGISQSALNNLDTSRVFAGYEAQWAELMGQLAADPAGNLQLQIGLLSNLETENKRNLVEAINESMHIIDGIPVDLTGIYNTQVIGFDEASGKLVPMINVARTQTIIPNISSTTPWEIIVGVTGGRVNEPSFQLSSTNPVGVARFTQSYNLSEFTTGKINLRYQHTQGSTIHKIRFSKSPTFDTVAAEYRLSSYATSTSSTQSFDITNLIGNYYIEIEMNLYDETAGLAYVGSLSFS